MQILMLHEAGSSSRYWSSAIRILRRSGIDVVYGTVRQRGAGHLEAEAAGCETFSLDCETSRDYPRAAVRFAKVVRGIDPDIVHLNEPISAAVGGVGGAIVRHPRRIFHRQHTIVEGRQRHLSRIGSRLTHMTMAISDAVVRAARTERLPDSKICLAYNGVPQEPPVPQGEAESLRERMGLALDATVILLVGRLRPEKGHRVLLRAVEAMENEGVSKLHVVIVGGSPAELGATSQAPPEIRQVEADSRKLQTPFHFVGHQSPLAPWHAIADVAVVPSLREPFGLVAPEAMAASLPLVASDVDGLPEIVIHGRSGLLVPPADPMALARALTSLIEDPELARRLGEGGRARYEERFTDEHMVASWISCYDALMNAR